MSNSFSNSRYSLMLTDTKIKQLKPTDKTYRIADSNGLSIEVRVTGSKLWRYRYRFNAKPNMISLGEYPSVTLAQARKGRDKMKELLQANIDPAQHIRNEKLAAQQIGGNTFEALAEEWLQERTKTHSEEYVQYRRNWLELDIYPKIGKKNIKDVTSADVLDICRSTVKRVTSRGRRATGESQAKNNRQLISAIMNHAIMTLRADNDPTYAVRRAVPLPPKETARPLTAHEQSNIMFAIEACNSTETVKNAIRTLLYSMLRSSEVRKSKWEFIDFERKLWAIPAVSQDQLKKGERNMKKNRTHIVPLSDQLIEVLKAQKLLAGISEYIFPSPYNFQRIIDGLTINRALWAMGFANLTAHDFRATASTRLHELGYNTEHIEMQLAHVDRNATRATYNHAMYLSVRHEMMQAWANEIDSWAKSSG